MFEENEVTKLLAKQNELEKEYRINTELKDNILNTEKGSSRNNIVRWFSNVTKEEDFVMEATRLKEEADAERRAINEEKEAIV